MRDFVGWIKHSTHKSRMAALVLFSEKEKKKDNSLHLYVDYHGLNAL